MPVDWSRYPRNWKRIRRGIIRRSAGRCEWCAAENYQPHPVTASRVVLTIAHMNHDTTDNADENLKALCQRCHNRYDREHRNKNSAATRKRKREIKQPSLL